MSIESAHTPGFDRSPEHADDVIAESKEMVKIMKCLSNKVRLRILGILLLQKEELTVTELAEKTNISPAAISQHLPKLHKAHLVGFQHLNKSKRWYFMTGEGRQQVAKVLALLQHDFTTGGETRQTAKIIESHLLDLKEQETDDPFTIS